MDITGIPGAGAGGKVANFDLSSKLVQTKLGKIDQRTSEKLRTTAAHSVVLPDSIFHSWIWS